MAAQNANHILFNTGVLSDEDFTGFDVKARPILEIEIFDELFCAFVDTGTRFSIAGPKLYAALLRRGHPIVPITDRACVPIANSHYDNLCKTTLNVKLHGTVMEVQFIIFLDRETRTSVGMNFIAKAGLVFDFYNNVYYFGKQEKIKHQLKIENIKSITKTSRDRSLIPVKDRFLQRNEILSLDIYGPLPEAQHGERWVFIVEDQATKWTEIFALKNGTAEEAASVLIEEYFMRYGLPRTVITDLNNHFAPAVMNLCMSVLGVQQRIVVANHPEGHSLNSKNSDLKVVLWKMAMNTRKWPRKLPIIRFYLNSARFRSTGATPAYLNLGRKIRTPSRSVIAILHKDNVMHQITPYLKNLISSHISVQRMFKMLSVKAMRAEGLRLRFEMAAKRSSGTNCAMASTNRNLNNALAEAAKRKRAASDQEIPSLAKKLKLLRLKFQDELPASTTNSLDNNPAQGLAENESEQNEENESSRDDQDISLENTPAQDAEVTGIFNLHEHGLPQYAGFYNINLLEITPDIRTEMAEEIEESADKENQETSKECECHGDGINMEIEEDSVTNGPSNLINQPASGSILEKRHMGTSTEQNEMNRKQFVKNPVQTSARALRDDPIETPLANLELCSRCIKKPKQIASQYVLRRRALARIIQDVCPPNCAIQKSNQPHTVMWKFNAQDAKKYHCVQDTEPTMAIIRKTPGLPDELVVVLTTEKEWSPNIERKETTDYGYASLT